MAKGVFDWNETGIRFKSPGMDGRPLAIRWDAIREIEAVEPWPCFQIAWSRPHGPDWRTFTPYLDDHVEFERRVEALFAEAAVRAPDAVKRGWLDHPAVSWERVDDLPRGEEDPVGGAYRGRAPEKVLARRRPPYSLEALIQRLVIGRPPQSYDAQPREVVVTPLHLYKRGSDERCWRIVRSS